MTSYEHLRESVRICETVRRRGRRALARRALWRLASARFGVSRKLQLVREARREQLKKAQSWH